MFLCSNAIRLPICSIRRPYVFLGFSTFILLLFIFHFSSETGHWTKTKIWEMDDPYMEGIETKFQRDLLTGFAERDVLPYLLSVAW